MRSVLVPIFKNGQRVGDIPVNPGMIADKEADTIRENLKKTFDAIIDCRRNPESPWRTNPKMVQAGIRFLQLDFDHAEIDLHGTKIAFDITLPPKV